MDSEGLFKTSGQARRKQWKQLVRAPSSSPFRHVRTTVRSFGKDPLLLLPREDYERKHGSPLHCRSLLTLGRA